jgi:hypothetical protein
MTDEFKTTYLYPKHKSIELMRWIRLDIKNDIFIELS